MDFNIEDCYYLFIQVRDEKSVVKLERNYDWSYETVDGVIFDLGTLFSNMDIDEIVDSLRNNFDIVELIDESDIDDYLND
jgi:hypothetical protein